MATCPVHSREDRLSQDANGCGAYPGRILFAYLTREISKETHRKRTQMQGSRNRMRPIGWPGTWQFCLEVAAGAPP